jgi:SAM-dependent methyltransferase
MTNPVRRLARRVLERTGLIAPYYRWLEQRQAAALAGEDVDDGRPMPPAELIVLVSGPSRAWFSERGRADAAQFRELAARHGADVAAGLDVLDFGCGAGRIARWLGPEVIAAGGTFCGSDLNPKLATWCETNLAGTYRTNGLQPPLANVTNTLDLVYAHSVLTHLTEPTAQAWLAEVARVLRPGGLALLTFHDEVYAQAFAPDGVAARLAAEPYIVWNNAMEGSNYISAWTTRARLAEMASGAFDVVEISPGRNDEPAQAIAVLRARP